MVQHGGGNLRDGGPAFVAEGFPTPAQAVQIMTANGARVLEAPYRPENVLATLYRHHGQQQPAQGGHDPHARAFRLCLHVASSR
jgi:hypothetical protein